MNKKKKRQINRAAAYRNTVSQKDLARIYNQSAQGYDDKIISKGGGKYLHGTKPKQKLSDAQIQALFMGARPTRAEVERAAVERHQVLSQKQIDTIDDKLRSDDHDLLVAVVENGAQTEYEHALETMNGDPDEHAIALRQLMEACEFYYDGNQIHKVFFGDSD